jgi:hypothetical protein
VELVTGQLLVVLRQSVAGDDADPTGYLVRAAVASRDGVRSSAQPPIVSRPADIRRSPHPSFVTGRRRDVHSFSRRLAAAAISGRTGPETLRPDRHETVAEPACVRESDGTASSGGPRHIAGERGNSYVVPGVVQ